MYAVLDIEATGGKMGEEEIIEIAIYRFDGKEVTDRLISLVSPDREIQPFVARLTQITPKMVRTAPKFHELAKRIVQITDDAILVGHNVEFDYRMLKQEFRKLGYKFSRNIIDTVPLSEKYFPEAASHSLGKLCKEIGIPMSDRHRAAGDARATLDLFKLLLDKDSSKSISKISNEFQGNHQSFEKYYRELPNEEGLFYFLNHDKEVIYLASAKNIAMNVRKMLTGKSALKRQIQLNFESVRYELSGNPLISQIKELDEIGKLNPAFNKSGRNSYFAYTICMEEQNGIRKLCLHRVQKKRGIQLLFFRNLKTALKTLKFIKSRFQLLEIHEKPTESSEFYEERIQALLDIVDLRNQSFLLTGTGRKLGENSFVLIKDGQCRGYGYYQFHNQIKNPKTLTERMIPLDENTDFNPLIRVSLIYEKYNELISLNSHESHSK